MTIEIENEQTEQAITDNNPTPHETTTPQFDAADSLARLILGALLEGPDELARRLESWEKIIAENNPQTAEETAVSQLSDTEFERLRYALVGMAFQGQGRARRAIRLFGKTIYRTTNVAYNQLRPLTNNRFMRPLQRQYDQFVQEGESVVNRWIELGKQEAPRSRALAREAVGNTVDDVIVELAHNPEVKGLVQQQSVGIATDMVDGVRARTVTADDILERMVRGILKRPPREQLPSPSPEVKAQAERMLREEDLVDDA